LKHLNEYLEAQELLETAAEKTKQILAAIKDIHTGQKTIRNP
jgi:hypothetical protein